MLIQYIFYWGIGDLSDYKIIKEIINIMDTIKTKVPRAEFVLSVAHYKEMQPSDMREFCVMGRSNVGKSSFINHVFGDNGLARVSKKPGKTTLANFFKVNNDTAWVDLPGYGHAKRAKTEQARWSKLIADYCENRKNLAGVVWLCDIRHPGLEIDKEACTWLGKCGLPILMVLTKADKLTKNEQFVNAKKYAAVFNLETPPVLYSNTTTNFRDAFWAAFTAWSAMI